RYDYKSTGLRSSLADSTTGSSTKIFHYRSFGHGPSERNVSCHRMDYHYTFGTFPYHNVDLIPQGKSRYHRAYRNCGRSTKGITRLQEKGYGERAAIEATTVG